MQDKIIKRKILVYKRRVQNLECQVYGFKTCSKCKKVYPATRDYFRANKRNKDFLRYECKNCSIK